MEEGLETGEANKKPVKWDEKDVFDQIPGTALGTADHVVIEIEKVAEDGGEGGQVENGGGVDRLDGRSDETVEDKIGESHNPKEGINEHEGDLAAHSELEDEGVPAVVTKKLQGVTVVNQKGLEVAFDPAGTLPNPVAKFAIGFLVSRGVDNGRGVASFEEAGTEVAILSNVESIPTVEFFKDGGAEVIGSAA